MTTDHLPRYRVLTGPDDATFCYRVSEALDLGYKLYGSPALTVKDPRAAGLDSCRRPDPGRGLRPPLPGRRA